MNYSPGHSQSYSQSDAQNQSDASRTELAIVAILLATACYQVLLCFLNTHGFGTSRGLLGLTEAMIYFACIPFFISRLLPGVVVLTLFVAALLCMTTLISDQINVKAFRDVIIPLCYFWLGATTASVLLAEKIMIRLIAIVLVFALLETFFLDYFTSIFDIFGYYVSTGNLEPITDYVRESRLQLNGIRPEGIGRTLLPSLLGSHRVSSIFLEPVSLGNFATVCAAWGLSRDSSQLRKILLFVGAAILLMILSDSRFALLSVTLMIFMRLVISGKALKLTIVAPFACVLLLLFVGLTTTDNLGDNFRGRLAVSGWSLLDFDVATLMGTSPGKQYGDQGYAYALSNFGLPLCLLMWFSLWILPVPNQSAERFRAYLCVYIALILCVSGTSLFALKTAGIVWFLMGSCVYSPTAFNPRENHHVG
jgi:putative polymerase